MNISNFLNAPQASADLTADDYNFIARVLSFISNGMKLPLNLDSAEVITCIQNNTPKYYQICPWATVDDKLVFNLSKLNRPTKEFFPDVTDESMIIATDTIILPPKVEEVFELKWIERGYGTVGGFDYASWKLEAMMSNSMMGNPMHNNAGADTYMASVFVSNTLRSLGTETVAYDYNPLTYELKIHDSNKRTGLIGMEVARRIPLKALYADDWYLRYIASLTLKAKLEHMKMFDAKLPGDLALNVGDIETRANDMYDKVIEYLEQETEHHLNFIKS
jgi:hypothetical protein